jgi:iron(III) transport system substrate-binding protein
LVFSILFVVGCTSNEKTAETKPKEQSVNLYTDRHYEADQQIFDAFTKETGIKVNVVSAKSDEILERLIREGKNTQADLLYTTDAGRLGLAKSKGMLASVESDVLTKNIPANLRDVDNEWFGLTVRARVLVYAKDRVNPKDLSTYEDLANPKWKGKILVRPSSNIYNQSLIASFLELKDEAETKKWAEGLVANMAREPKGNDRDQATAVAAGEGDIAIMNTYYIGLMLNSANPEEVEVAKKVGVFFPNQQTTGTHVNISGAGLTKYAKNKDNAIELLEYMSKVDAQKLLADSNYEYPANESVEPADLLQSWGEFKRQDINLSKLGENNTRAVQLLNEVGWK